MTTYDWGHQNVVDIGECSFLEHPYYLCVGHVQGAFNCPHQNTEYVLTVVLQALLFQ